MKRVNLNQVRKRASQSFELQQNESDCGVAALASIIQFHGGYVPMERLRSLSGTTTSGTTMLGLLQAGNTIGLVTEAFESTIEELKKLSEPVLMHIVKNDRLEHYIVCYGLIDNRFLIGDPEEGIKSLTPENLENQWKSKALLLFSKDSAFVQKSKIDRDKYQWLLKALVQEKHLVISTLIIGIVVSALGFSTAIFTEKLIDNLIPTADSSIIVLGLCAWLILLFIKLFFGYVRELTLVKQGFELNNRLTGDFIVKMLSLPKAFFDSRKKGDLISRLFDTGRVQSSVATIISQDIIDLLSLITAIFFVQFYSGWIALFLVFIIPAYFLIIYSFYSKIYESNKQLMISFSGNEAAYIDVLTGIEPLKQQSKEHKEADHLRQYFRKFQEDVVNSERIGISFKLATDAFGTLAIFFILAYCVTSVIDASIELGDMMAIFSISAIALGSTNRLAYAASHIQEAKAALDRTYDIVSLESDSDAGLELMNITSINVEKISFRFPGHAQLFKDVSFSIRKSEVTLLLGENGSGKTTILQILQRFYDPEQGAITLDQTPLKLCGQKSLRKLLGVVPQNVKIFNESLAYNITLDHEITTEEVLDFCSKSNFLNFLDSFRDGLNTILGEEGINVSGGQKQMIGLLRALFNKPEFLLLDEFTSAMDRETKKFAVKLIGELKSSTGIFLITHDQSLVELASHKVSLSRD